MKPTHRPPLHGAPISHELRASPQTSFIFCFLRREFLLVLYLRFFTRLLSPLPPSLPPSTVRCGGGVFCRERYVYTVYHRIYHPMEGGRRGRRAVGVPAVRGQDPQGCRELSRPLHRGEGGVGRGVVCRGAATSATSRSWRCCCCCCWTCCV